MSIKLDIKRAILLTVLLLTGTSQVDADVLGFDTLTDESFPNTTYGTLNWGDSWAVKDTASYMETYSNTWGAVSPEQMANNRSGVEFLYASSPTDFDFEGAYVASWAGGNSFQTYSSTTLTIEGWDDGLMVFTKTQALSTTGFEWFSADYDSIDSLVFINDGIDPLGLGLPISRWWLMDEFTLTPVPEPNSLGFLGAMILAVCGFRRRKRE